VIAALGTEHLIIIVLLGALLLVGLVPSRHEPDSSFLANQRWRYRDLIIVWGVLTVIAFVPGPGMSKMTGLPLWAVDALTTLLFAATAWGVVRWNHRQPWRALGINPSTAFYDTLWSLRIALGVASVLTIIVALLRSSASDAYGPLGPPVWRGQVGAFIAAVAFTTIIVPIAEEFFFRGVAYGPLFRKFGAAGATVSSAALWAASHYDGPSARSISKVLVLLILGVVYAEVYRRRESLVPTVVFHIVGNTVGIFRDGYLVTLIPAAGVSVGLWIISAVLFQRCRRSRISGTPG
jgi:membrane protease YdiL (CAAX protease family)